MKKMFVALSLALMPLTISPALAPFREPTYHPSLPPPDPGLRCIVILGRVICW
jgi:hypothetical protein